MHGQQNFKKSTRKSWTDRETIQYSGCVTAQHSRLERSTTLPVSSKNLSFSAITQPYTQGKETNSWTRYFKEAKHCVKDAVKIKTRTSI
jgi:hypothetical protein